jgi:hypothetical protein
VAFTYRALYSWGNVPRYPLGRRLSGPQRWFGYCGQESNLTLFFNWYSGGGVQLGPLGTEATDRPIVPTPGDYDEGKIGGMMIDRGNRSTRRKPVQVSFVLQKPHMLCPDANPGRRGGKPGTSGFIYGTAESYPYRDSNSCRLARSPSLYRLSYPRQNSCRKGYITVAFAERRTKFSETKPVQMLLVYRRSDIDYTGIGQGHSLWETGHWLTCLNYEPHGLSEC